MINEAYIQQIGRRTFLQGSTLILATTACSMKAAASSSQETSVRLGLVTDLHYADKQPAGSRHYRETLSKLEEVAEQFKEDKPDVLVELGDFIDAADSVETERTYLKTINAPFTKICEDRHYVLGNHCVDTLKKEEFLEGVGQERSYYSFDRGDQHFIVLDACFREDGTPYGRKNFTWTDTNIPAAELDWLKEDLKANHKPTIIFAHQRLDVSNSHGVKNNEEVRKVLEKSGNVRAVFQGHSHQNDLKEIAGIQYCTLVAMVEGSGETNSGYSIADIKADGSIHLSGFRKQKSYDWKV